MNSLMPAPLLHFLRPLLVVVPALLASACGDEASTEPNRDFDLTPRVYDGPAPANDVIAAFQTNLWNHISVQDRCGECHGVGGQSPQFARSDDINLAFAALDGANLVDLANPEDSRLVAKIASGHNCWSTLGACEEEMTTYIRNWALATVGGPAAEVQLVPPPVNVPGATKNFPASSDLFGTHVWPLLDEYCSECHSPAADSPQAPYFAAPDVAAAYAAARNAINLNEPSISRFVQRLRDESHNCWDVCAENADEMQAAITNMANAIVVTPLPDGTIASHALGLREGIVASGGGRHEANLVAKYEFKEGSGSVVRDTSGISPALDLTRSSSGTEWVGGWGMRFDGGKAQGSTLASRKLQQMLGATGEYSIEAWVAPGNVSQEGPARIVSYSGGDDVRNFMLGQSMYNYDFLNRNSRSDANGEPALSTADAAERLQATLQHVVVTYTAAGGRRIYVNGEYTGDVDPLGPGTLGNWDDSFALVLGSEVDGSNPFRGVIRMLAIHSRALNDEQIVANFDAGVGERFFLLFGIGHRLPDTPQVYVLMEGSQFDSYSYLFAAPRLVSLTEGWEPDGLRIEGMRIGINGREVGLGQAFLPLRTVSDSDWVPGVGDELSRQGTVIPLEQGPDFDQFFLTFERLGALTHVVAEAVPPPPADVIGEAQPDIGLRLFETINAALSDITTIQPTTEDVFNTYERVKQQLPASDAIGGFSSAHQIGITQLAIEYCNALVESPTSSVYFAGFNVNESFNTAFNSTGKRAALVDPLIVHVANTNLLTMPDALDMSIELNALIDRLIASCTGTCAAAPPQERTQTIAKAVCTAAAGNASLLLL